MLEKGAEELIRQAKVCVGGGMVNILIDDINLHPSIATFPVH